MSRAAFIENVARKDNMSKAEAKRTVDLVLGEIEAGLKKSKKEDRYTIGNFGTFTITRRKARTPRASTARRSPRRNPFEHRRIDPGRRGRTGFRQRVLPCRQPPRLGRGEIGLRLDADREGRLLEHRRRGHLPERRRVPGVGFQERPRPHDAGRRDRPLLPAGFRQERCRKDTVRIPAFPDGALRMPDPPDPGVMRRAASRTRAHRM